MKNQKLYLSTLVLASTLIWAVNGADYTITKAIQDTKAYIGNFIISSNGTPAGVERINLSGDGTISIKDGAGNSKIFLNGNDDTRAGINIRNGSSEEIKLTGGGNSDIVSDSNLNIVGNVVKILAGVNTSGIYNFNPNGPTVINDVITKDFFDKNQNILISGTNMGVKGTLGNVSNGFNMSYGLEAGQNVAGSQHIAIGYQAGQNVAGYNNQAIGYAAGQNVNGQDNLGIGYGSSRNIRGGFNHAIGQGAGTNINGSSNQIFGAFAGRDLTGDYNIGIGEYGLNYINGSNNIGLGFQAMRFINGSQNIAIGLGALNGSSSSSKNVNNTISIGFNANALTGGYGVIRVNNQRNYVFNPNGPQGPDDVITKQYYDNNQILQKSGYNYGFTGALSNINNSSTVYNLGFGPGAGNFSTGYGNYSIGENTSRNLIGNFNNIIGLSAGQNTYGSNNIINGTNAGQNIKGDGNIAMGENAGTNITGSNNLLFGYHAGSYNKNGSYNSIFGDMAGYYATGSENTMIGRQAGYFHNSNYGTFLGGLAGMLSSGNYNVGIGYQGNNSANGNYNIGIGNRSNENSNGSYNIGLGYLANKQVKGIRNIAIGNEAGDATSGNYNVNIGGRGYYSNGWPNYIVGDSNYTIGPKLETQNALTGNGNIRIFSFTTPFSNKYLSGIRNVTLGADVPDKISGNGNYFIGTTLADYLGYRVITGNNNHINGNITNLQISGDINTLIGTLNTPYPYGSSSIKGNMNSLVGNYGGAIPSIQGDNNSWLGNMNYGNVIGSTNLMIGPTAANIIGNNNIGIGTYNYSYNIIGNLNNNIGGIMNSTNGNNNETFGGNLYNVTGSNNGAYGASMSYITGSTNAAVGSMNIQNISGSENSFLGGGSMNSVSGDRNTLVGRVGTEYWWESQGINGSDNLVFGNKTVNITGSFNNLFGYKVGNYSNGGQNTIIGNNAGSSLNGDFNQILGNYAGRNIVGDNNISYGENAGSYSNGSYNQSLGINAGLYSNGNNNYSYGSNAGRYTVGSNNYSFGEGAGIYVKGTYNLGIGISAGQYVTGNSNQAFGDRAGGYINGNMNLSLGYNAGQGTGSSPRNLSHTISIGANSKALTGGYGVIRVNDAKDYVFNPNGAQGPDDVITKATLSSNIGPVLHLSGNHYNVVSYNFNGIPTNGIKIKTNFPYSDASQMPEITINGYNYGLQKNIGIKLSYYIYNGNFINYSASSFGDWTPTIKLANEGGKVVIFLDSRDYFTRFGVDAYARGMGEQNSWFEGWSVADENVSGSNIVTLPYNNTVGSLTTNGSITANGNITTTNNITANGLIRSTANGAPTFQGGDDTTINDVNVVNTLGIIGIQDSTRGQLQLGNNTNTYIHGANGNIGIGTTNPSTKLDVNGVVNANSFTWGDNGSRTEFRDDAGLQGNSGARSGFFQTSSPVNYPAGANNWWHLLDVRHGNPTNNYAMQFAGSFYDQNIYFRKTNNNPAQAWSKIVAENPSGNVGIGIDPVAKLDVNGKIVMRTNTDLGSNRFTIGTRNQISGIPHASGGHITQILWGDANFDPEGAGNDGDRGLEFGPHQNTYLKMLGTDTIVGRSDGKVTINSNSVINGNLGVGINASNKFEVSGTRSNTINYASAIGSIGGDDIRIAMGSLMGTPNWGTWIQSLRTNDNDSFPLSINPNGGNVGIGTNNPTEMLDVNGNVKANNVSVPSDIRYKKDINTLSGVLQKLDSIRGVSYFFKTDIFSAKNFDTKQQIGVIAQEIEKMFPQLVTTDKDGYKTVDYNKLSAVLLQAIKEQQIQIEQYKLRLETLEKKYESQQKQLDEIQKTLDSMKK